jgi:hypothetical protein
VLRLIAVELVRHVGRRQLCIQRVGLRDRKERVVDGEVPLHRDVDLRGVDVVERRHPIPDDRHVRLG